METTPLIMHFIRNKVKEGADSNTSAPQVRVLAFIETNPGCSLTNLSDSLGITSASASTMIDRLVKAGLVNRIVHPAKRRNVVLHLTAVGQKQLLGARKISVQALSHRLASLDNSQLKHVEETMTLLKSIFSTVYGDTDSNIGSHIDSQTEPAFTKTEPSLGWHRGKVES